MEHSMRGFFLPAKPQYNPKTYAFILLWLKNNHIKMALKSGFIKKRGS